MKSSDNPSLFEEITGLSGPRAVLVSVPALALIAASIWVAVHFLQPLPPRTVVLAAGPEGSALHALGLRYAELIGRHGVRVEVVATHGAADNLDRLTRPTEQASVGFVLAGMATPEQAQRIVNVSNLTHVPLWCLARVPSGEITLASLRGQRLAVGAPGTGLHAWLLPLLRLNGVTPENTAFLELSTADSVRALAEGKADTVCLADGVEGPHLDAAIELPGVRVMSFPRAEAYARRFPNIVSLHLPAGTLDFARGIPDRNLALIGTTAMLAARADLHPTVVDLFVDSARALHSAQGIFDRRGEFPNLDSVDNVPVSAQAHTYSIEGPSLLRRYLPLWAADAGQRMIVLAIPLLAVVLPLVRYLPTVMDLVGQRHLLLGYAGLRRIDRRARARRPEDPVDDLLHDLERIEDSIAGIRESVFKAGDLYTFRVHLRLVREALTSHAARRVAARRAAAAVETVGQP